MMIHEVGTVARTALARQAAVLSVGAACARGWPSTGGPWPGILRHESDLNGSLTGLAVIMEEVIAGDAPQLVDAISELLGAILLADVEAERAQEVHRPVSGCAVPVVFTDQDRRAVIASLLTALARADRARVQPRRPLPVRAHAGGSHSAPPGRSRGGPRPRRRHRRKRHADRQRAQPFREGGGAGRSPGPHCPVRTLRPSQVAALRHRGKDSP